MSKSGNRTQKGRDAVIDTKFTKASRQALIGVSLGDLKRMTPDQIRQAYNFGPDENPAAIKIKPGYRANAVSR